MLQSKQFLNYGKALLIVLFVYVQVQRGLFRAGLPVGNEYFHILDSVLNSFILPLAFVLMGFLFAKESRDKTRSYHFLTLINCVVYPYFLWVVVQGVFQTQFNFLTQSNYSIVHIVSLLPIEPYGHFQYLYSTFFIALISLVLFWRRPQILLFIGFVAAAGLYVFRDVVQYVFALRYVAPYLVFFLLGAILSIHFDRLKQLPSFSASLSLIVLLFSQWFFHRFIQVDTYVFSFSLLVLSVVSVLCWVVILSSLSSYQNTSVQHLGEAAFAIFILHFLLGGGTRVILLDVFGIDHVLVHVLLGCIVSLLGGVMIYRVSKRLKLDLLWAAPTWCNAHTVSAWLTTLWQQKPITKPLSLLFVSLLILPLAFIYLASEWFLNQKYPLAEQMPSIALSENPTDIENGKRFAQVYGCYLGCHGKEMEGSVLEDLPFEGRIVAPNLTQAVHEYKPEELAAIVTQGLRPDGTALHGWMPIAAYQYIDDKILSDILSFIYVQDIQTKRQPKQRFGWLPRIEMVKGQYEVEHELALEYGFDKASMSQGEKLARSACGECHGADLAGGEFAPTLHIVKAYSFEAFKHLQRTGYALGEREVGLMSLMAKNRFSLLTDSELEALYDYLKNF